MDLRIALAVALVCTLTACGGGGDGDGPGPDLKCVTQPQAVLSGTLYMNTGVHSGDSAGASDGGGDGDGAGSLGQFRKTLVIVRDKNLNEIGRAVITPVQAPSIPAAKPLQDLSDAFASVADAASIDRKRSPEKSSAT